MGGGLKPYKEVLNLRRRYIILGGGLKSWVEVLNLRRRSII